MFEHLESRALDPQKDPDWYAWGYPFYPRHLPTDIIRAQIRPLAETSSRLIWNQLVRRNQFTQLRQLPRRHWFRRTSVTGPQWLPLWDDPTLRDDVVEFLRRELPWNDELPVVFVSWRDRATLATWGAFLAAWRNFVVADEDWLVVSWLRAEFAGFGGGRVHVGTRTDLNPECEPNPWRSVVVSFATIERLYGTDWCDEPIDELDRTLVQVSERPAQYRRRWYFDHDFDNRSRSNLIFEIESLPDVDFDRLRARLAALGLQENRSPE